MNFRFELLGKLVRRFRLAILLGSFVLSHVVSFFLLRLYYFLSDAMTKYAAQTERQAVLPPFFLLNVFLWAVFSGLILVIFHSFVFRFVFGSSPISPFVAAKAIINSWIITSAITILRAYILSEISFPWLKTIDGFLFGYKGYLYTSTYLNTTVVSWWEMAILSLSAAAIAVSPADYFVGEQTVWTFSSSVTVIGAFFCSFLYLNGIQRRFGDVIKNTRRRGVFQENDTWLEVTNMQQRLRRSYFIKGALVTRELFALRTAAIFAILVFLFDPGNLTLIRFSDGKAKWSVRAEALSLSALLLIALYSSWYPTSTSNSFKMVRTLIDTGSSRGGALTELHNSRAAYHLIKSDDTIAAMVERGHGSFLPQRSHLYEGKWRPVFLACLIWKEVRGLKVRRGIGGKWNIDPNGTRPVRFFDIIAGEEDIGTLPSTV